MSYVAGSSLAPGTTVAGYRIEALIGRGGMGAVYRAEEEGLGRKVALKVIAPELAQDSRFRERFLRESRIAASLDHPHIVPIFKAGEEGGALFLAMRYVEGTDLSKLLHEGGALDPARAIALLEQVAEALDTAHERGLVHRDVKPSNVLITVAGGKEHAYLADFGLTKRTGSLSGISAQGDVVGTLEYVAPEQITGDEVQGRADLYSLGCVLYEVLTGQPPFPRATDIALLWAHVHEEAKRPSEIRSELPHAIDGVLARALAKEPGRRYETSGELVASARAALGLVETAPAAPGTRRWKLAAVAVLLIAASLALGFVLLGGSGGGLSSVSPNSVGVIDPASNELVAEVPVGIDPEAVTVGEGAVWVANVGDETVSRVNPAEVGARPRTIAVGGYPSDVTVGAGSVWVALGALAELARINPEQNTVASPIAALGEGAPCGAPRASTVVAAGYVWFVCEVAEVGRVTASSGASRRVGLECGLLTSSSSVLPEFADVASGLGALWIVNRTGNAVLEVDPVVCREPRPITVGVRPTAVAVGANSVWVANFDDDSVTRIDIAGAGQTPDTTPIAVGDGPVDVAVGEGGVWVANKLDRSITRIDPDTGKVVARIPTGNEPQRLAAGEGRVWVTMRSPEPSTREEG